METIKVRWSQVKEYVSKYSLKTRIAVAAAIAVVGIGSIALAVYLNNTAYEVLFSGVADTEAQAIVAMLQADGVDYRYSGDGEILVDKDVADQTRVALVYSGYPKEGFTYDTFINNAGGMATDFENQQYKLYELQDRMSANIRLFSGVEDAKVNIVVDEQEQYVLAAETAPTASASVVLVMEEGVEPTEKLADAVQRLVAQGSVPGLIKENVEVLDSHGMAITVTDDEEDSLILAGNLAEELAREVENELAKKVINVLTPFYGEGNVKVSVRGVINMDKILRESSIYTTPDKIDINDKTGIVSNEITSTQTATEETTPNEVVGTETNADTEAELPDTEVDQYNGDAETTTTVLSEEAQREYLVNQVIEQTEVEYGSLEDLTVSVSVNSPEESAIDIDDLMDLVGNATGIGVEERNDKITIIAAPFYDASATDPAVTPPANVLEAVLALPLPILLAIGGGILLLIAIIVALAVRSRRKRRMAEEEGEEFEEIIEGEDGEIIIVNEDGEEVLATPEEFNLRNERSHELREMIRTFAEENPEISAQMIKTWLNGGEPQDGRKEG